LQVEPPGGLGHGSVYLIAASVKLPLPSCAGAQLTLLAAPTHPVTCSAFNCCTAWHPVPEGSSRWPSVAHATSTNVVPFTFAVAGEPLIRHVCRMLTVIVTTLFGGPGVSTSLGGFCPLFGPSVINAPQLVCASALGAQPRTPP